MFALSLAYVMAFTLDLWGLLSSLVQQPQFLVSVLALLTPLGIATLKQPWLRKSWHRPVAWLFSAGVGFLTVYTTGQFNPADLLTSLVLIVAATEGSYHMIWKHTYTLSFWETFTNLPFFKDKFGDAGDDPGDGGYYS